MVVPPVVSASPMRHWADATLDPALYRPEILLYPSKKKKVLRVGENMVATEMNKGLRSFI